MLQLTLSAQTLLHVYWLSRVRQTIIKHFHFELDKKKNLYFSSYRYEWFIQGQAYFKSH